MPNMSASTIFFSAILALGIMSAGLSSANAACLSNQSRDTVYVKMSSNKDGGVKVGNLVVGLSFCLPVSKGHKATAKITPYPNARIGCKVEIVGDETLELVKFGTMNNCVFVPGR